jgi:hypothetical protein
MFLTYQKNIPSTVTLTFAEDRSLVMDVLTLVFFIYRIGLCGFDNPMRDSKTEEIKRHVGHVSADCNDTYIYIHTAFHLDCTG